MTDTFDKTATMLSKCYNVTIVSEIFQIQYNTSGICKMHKEYVICNG